MEYKFIKADETMLDNIFCLFEKRVKWMDEVGIKQWNVTGYLEAYPKSYYKEQIQRNRVYVMIDSTENSIVGTLVLFEKDERWESGIENNLAYYLHNFATDTKVKGIGKIMLEKAEELARKNNKKYLRLDCADDNDFLNNYYEGSGYHFVGKYVDGPYKGNKREKILL